MHIKYEVGTVNWGIFQVLNKIYYTITYFAKNNDTHDPSCYGQATKFVFNHRIT